MKAVLELSRRQWKLPTIRYGAVIYICALLLAVGFRRFVVGKYYAYTGYTFWIRLTREYVQTGMIHTSVERL